MFSRDTQVERVGLHLTRSAGASRLNNIFVKIILRPTNKLAGMNVFLLACPPKVYNEGVSYRLARICGGVLVRSLRDMPALSTLLLDNN